MANLQSAPHCISAQSRFTATERVCQIPDNPPNGAHSCSCRGGFWHWGEKIPPNLFISPKEDSGEISKHMRGESNEITSLKHHKQGPIWSYVLLSLRPDSRGWGGVMNTLSVMVSSALQNGLSSGMEAWRKFQEEVKCIEVSAYLTILGLLDNQYVLIYSSHKGDKRLRNSSISPSSFRLLWRMNEVTMVLICVLFNLK